MKIWPKMQFSDGPYALDKKKGDAVLRRLAVFRRETGTRKAVHVTYVTPDGLARGEPHGGVVLV